MRNSQTGITLNRHIMMRQAEIPGASGEFTALLHQIALAAKVVAREVNKAGIVDILGFTGESNIHQEQVRRLDAYADEVFCDALDHTGHFCIMASEEHDDAMAIPEEYPAGKYAIAFDPLDGSSNIDANVSIGTIFSIHRKVSDGPRGSIEDLLQPGSRQVAAGYIIYGSSTMLVYTTGTAVHGFTMDPSLGEFLLSNPNIRIPKRGKIYSVNEGNFDRWEKGVKDYVRWLKRKDGPTNRPYSSRYIGSMVADVHRTLLYGGIFMYPEDVTDPASPKPKLRLLYEASPLGFVIEAAGGRSSTGRERTLDVMPTQLHQRVPVFVGSDEDVRIAEQFIRGQRKLDE